MANQYKNKVVYNGATLIDLSDTTAVQSDVASGKYFYTASGQKVEGTASGGGGVITETIMDATITATDQDTSGYVVWVKTQWYDYMSETLVDDTNYIVTIDGTPYLCHANAVYGGGDIYCGDTEIVWGTPANSIYPFAIGSYASGNVKWMIGDNQPHSVKVERVISMSGGGSISWKNIYSNEVNVNWEGWSDNPNNNCYYVMIPWTEPIDYGSVWRITWDGTLYECTATLAGSSDGTPYMLGNNTYNELEGGNNEPFMLQRYDSNLAIASPDYGTHTILIEKQVTSSDATLITKTITENGTYSASDDNADGYSSVTVNITPPVTWETMADQTCTITTYDGMRIVTINGYNEPLSADETYRVTWGDDQYICNTIVDTAEFTQDGYLFGNISIFGSQYEDTGEPFVFYRTSSTRMTGVTNDTTSSSVYVKIEKQVPASSGGITPTGTVSITTNGTHDVTNYASASVSVTPNLQSKSATPTTSSQTVSPDNGYDGLSGVTVGAIPSQYIVPTGNKAITENGTGIDVTQYATVSVNVSTGGGSSKNVQTVQSTTRRNNTALGSVTSLTCSTAGTYDVYWTCARSNTSQTWGSRLYINSTAYGTENTSWSNNVQNNHLTNVVLSANDTVAVYGRSRSGYYIYAPQLTIVQTA